MTAVVVDTNVVSYLLRNHRLAVRYEPHLRGKLLAVSFMTLAEILYGGVNAGWDRQRLARIETSLRSRYLIVPSTRSVCVQWGEIRVERGARVISHADAWIAATARAYGWPLVTHDAEDFAGISGLSVLTA